MGKIEEVGRKRKYKRDLTRAILNAVQITAVAGTMLLAPNLPQALYKLGLVPKMQNDSSAIKRARKNLIHRGLVVANGPLRLTKKGYTALAILEATYRVKRPRWDGRWRVLIFDIPEYRKEVRDKIRRTLMHIGFMRLQDSVWVYPYDCEDLVVLLKADLRIGRDVLYMIVDELEGDIKLRREFGLPVSK